MPTTSPRGCCSDSLVLCALLPLGLLVPAGKWVGSGKGSKRWSTRLVRRHTREGSRSPAGTFMYGRRVERFLVVQCLHT